MKSLLKTTLALLAFATVFTSCSDDDSNSNNNNVNPASGFSWTENGGTRIVADSAFYVSQYKTIKAYKGQNMANFIEINLTNDDAATYTIGQGYAVSKLDANGIYAASAGDITISQKTATTMSGTITSTGSGANITSLNAEFTNIEVR